MILQLTFPRMVRNAFKNVFLLNILILPPKNAQPALYRIALNVVLRLSALNVPQTITYM